MHKRLMSRCLLDQRQTIVLQVPPAVNIELRQQLEDMGFSANK